MTSFSEANLVKKLGDLNNTQQSIQTLSLWLIHHRKHAKTIVNIWNSELRLAKESKKLIFLYLANDVIQNSKKKGNEFIAAFEGSLPKAFSHANKTTNEKTKASLNRLLTIWRERNVYNRNTLRHIKHALSFKDISPKGPAQETQSGAAPIQPSSASKKKVLEKTIPSLRDEITLVEVGEPPRPDDLVNALNELENSASSDAAVREKIAALPPEVSDVSYLDKISDKLEAETFDAMVDDACLLLTSYNGRLTQELDDRKKVAVMLRDFVAAQKQQLDRDEKILQECVTKQESVNLIREEIKSHIQNLPDLSLLPDLTGGLAPLPSAGDLFNI